MTQDPRADGLFDGREYDPAGYNFGDGYSTNLGMYDTHGFRGFSAI